MSKSCLCFLFLALLLPAEEIIMTCDFKSSGHGWSIPPYYQGKMEVVENGGRQDGALKLVATTDKKGHTWARTYRGVKAPWKTGKCLRISGYVRGKGMFLTGFAVTLPQPEGKNVFHYNEASPITLTDQWQHFEHFLDDGLGIPQDIQARLELEGAGEAWIDDLSISFVDSTNVKIAIQPAKVRISATDKIPEMVVLGKPGSEIMIFLLDGQNNILLKEKLVTNHQGRSGFFPSERLPAGHFQLRASAKGISATAEIEVLAK